MTLVITCRICGGDKWSGTLGTPSDGIYCSQCGPKSAEPEPRAETDAELWRALKADCEAVPCKYPCLRDDLHDWLISRTSGNGLHEPGGL